MIFSRRSQASATASREDQLRSHILPSCYDEFIGTKIYNIIEHPKPEGDRIFLCVKYAGSAAVKALGARWNPDMRRWWYWSGSTEQLAYYYDPEAWLHVLNQVHSQSLFADWPMDVDLMREMKCQSLGLSHFSDYCNPNPSVPATEEFNNPASEACKK